jgi:hypothetical protein
MTVIGMSHGELSRYDTLLRVERGELRVEDASALLGLHHYCPARPIVQQPGSIGISIKASSSKKMRPRCGNGGTSMGAGRNERGAE